MHIRIHKYVSKTFKKMFAICVYIYNGLGLEYVL